MVKIHSVEIYIDGACIPRNPGGAPVWGFFLQRDGAPVDIKGGLAAAEASEMATNSVAEYSAFNNALAEAKRRGWENDQVTVYTDSQFLYGQVEAGNKVKAAHLIPLNARAVKLKAEFASLKLVLIPRERNKVAHRAAWTAYLEYRLARN